MLDGVKKTMFFGLGLAALTKEKVESMVQDLVDEGQVSKDEGRELLDSWVRRADFEKEEIRKRVQTEVKKVLSGMGGATQTELEELKSEISELKARVAHLEARFSSQGTE